MKLAKRALLTSLAFLALAGCGGGGGGGGSTGFVPAPGGFTTTPTPRATPVSSPTPTPTPTPVPSPLPHPGFNASPAWVPFGPAPGFDAQQQQANVSGRSTSLLVDPQNSSNLLLGTASGGVWQSSDGGSTWTPRTDGLPAAIGALARDPNHGQTVWAGTGENSFSGDQLFGLGLLKSLDGGQTWTQIPDPLHQFREKSISRIVIDPANNSSTMFVATVPAFLAGERDNLPRSGQIFRSTDGGTTFVDVTSTSVIGPNAPVCDLIRRPDTGALIAAVDTTALLNGGDARSGLYRSTDEGTTWTKLTNGLPAGGSTGRISVAFAPSNPNDVYALVAGTGLSFQGVFASADGGTTWHKLSLTNDPFVVPNGGESLIGDNGGDQQVEYNQFIEVDPQNASRIYIGGLSMVRIDNVNLTSFSGTTVALGGNPEDTIHPHTDQHFAAFDASGSLYACDDGGIWKLPSPAAATLSTPWTNLNGNLETIQFYKGAIALDPSANLLAVGGTQDNGSFSFTGSNTWQEVDGGDGGNAQIDPVNTSLFYTTAGFGVSQDFLSQHLNGTLRDASGGINFNDSANAEVPFQVSPVNDNRMVLATTRIYETTNAAAVLSNAGANVLWHDLTGVLLTGAVGNGFPAVFTDVSYAPSNFGVVYAVSNSGRVFRRTTDGGAFSEADTGIPAGTFLVSVSVDPHSPNHAIVCAAQSTNGLLGQTPVPGRVFETNNSGALWRDVTGDLPNFSVTSVVMDPRFPDLFYAGTTQGVFVSQNDGGNWVPYGTGHPLAPTGQLVILADGHLADFTHGRSMWVTSTNTALTVTAPTHGVRPNQHTAAPAGGNPPATPRPRSLRPPHP